jgi:hypothetical protein
MCILHFDGRAWLGFTFFTNPVRDQLQEKGK